MVTMVSIGLALALAYYLGAYSAREAERRRFARGQIDRFEAELLRSRGRRMHPDPSAAPVVSRIRFVRR
jgi:hypothetical protein